MAKTNLEKIVERIEARLDKHEEKFEKILSEAIPKIKEDFVAFKTEVKTEAAVESKHHARFWGGVAIVISVVSGLAAFMK